MGQFGTNSFGDVFHQFSNSFSLILESLKLVENVEASARSYFDLGSAASGFGFRKSFSPSGGNIGSNLSHSV